MTPVRNHPNLRFSFPVLGLLIFGCSLTAGSGADLPATQTALAFAIVQYSTSGGSSPTPLRTAAPGARFTPSATRTRTPAFTATVTVTPMPTATATVLHSATPPDTSGATRYIIDPASTDYAAQKRAPAGADVYSGNYFERPFAAGTMEYLPDVDLERVELRIDPPWVYLTFQFAAVRAAGIGKTMYGAEFDTNRDSRGDYLIWGASPAGAAWTTDGVEVWKDSNYDVGGPQPHRSDAPWSGGNGYDLKLFSGGQGTDPDQAWIRQLAGGAKVQLAFKYSAIGSAPKFLWNGLADFGVRRPDWFDYNDHFTQADAGSPFPAQSDFYPLKALWGVDNTCRDAYGIAPQDADQGSCGA